MAGDRECILVAGCELPVEQIPPEYRMTICQRVQEWEKRLAEVHASCVACVFPDGYEGANKIGSGGPGWGRHRESGRARREQHAENLLRPCPGCG